MKTYIIKDEIIKQLEKGIKQKTISSYIQKKRGLIESAYILEGKVIEAENIIWQITGKKPKWNIKECEEEAEKEFQRMFGGEDDNKETTSETN